MTERTSLLRLTASQVRYQNRVFWRTPISAIFTLAFPLMFLVLFNLLFDGTFDVAGRGSLSVVQFYAPSLAVFAAASATYTNLTVGTAIARDEGILKRFRGTPLPPWSYLAGRIGSAVWIAVLAVAGMLAVAALAFGLEVPLDAVPALALTFGVGVACFASLGVAMAGLAGTGEAAPALANFTILPLAFISDVFLPLESPPEWLRTLADVFPLRHFAVAFGEPFAPHGGTHPAWGSLAVMGVWAAIGLLVAVRRFGWEPRGPAGPRRRRRRSPGRGT
jgi:ABC-2 type transport system permease protein